MGQVRNDRRRFIMAGFAASLGFPATVHAKPMPVGVVKSAFGRTEAELDAITRQLWQDDSVFIGDRITTARDARTRIALGEATELRLGPEGRIRIDRFLVNAGGVINLEAGPVLFDRDPARDKGPISLRSSYGLIAVRGTRFFAGPSNGVFGVFVERGSVAVTGGGKRVILTTGEGTDIAQPGARPTDPKAWGPARIQQALAQVL